MRVKTAHIYHYRSIRDLELQCGPCTVLVGPNNHGKSNVVGAFDFFFSSSFKPAQADFFQARGEDQTLWVDVTLHELTDQEKKTFEKYVDLNGEIQLRKCATLNPETGKAEVEYHGWLRQPKPEWLREGYASVKRSDLCPELIPHLPDDVRYSKAAVQEAQRRYIDAHRDTVQFEAALEDGPLLGTKNVASGVLPDVYVIPAVRDLTQDTVVKTTTLFGRILNRAITEMAETDAEFRKLRADLGGLVQRLNRGESEDRRPAALIAAEAAILNALRGWDVKLDIQIDPPDIEKVFELGTRIHVDDGVRTLAEDKGHGLQRAMIFALTTAWAEALRGRTENRENPVLPRGRSESVVLLIEEPELFLHPHAQRRLDASLRSLASSPSHQLILCTHSPQFINMNEYKHIAIVSKPSAVAGSKARQCTAELFAGEDNASRKRRFNMAHWINPERAEMFFARRIALVEGPTERVAIPFAGERLQCFDPEVSIIDCGSKYNLPLYMEVAGTFNLDHIVIHDEDPVNESLEGDALEKARRTFKLNDEIALLATKTGSRVIMVSPDFEGCIEVSKKQGHKKGKPLAAIDHLDGLQVEEFPVPLQQLVKAVYTV